MVECSTLDWRTWSILSSQGAGGWGSFGFGAGSFWGFDFGVVDEVELGCEPTLGALEGEWVGWVVLGFAGGVDVVSTGSLRTR